MKMTCKLCQLDFDETEYSQLVKSGKTGQFCAACEHKHFPMLYLTVLTEVVKNHPESTKRDLYLAIDWDDIESAVETIVEESIVAEIDYNGWVTN